jgi:hypothetical protein
MVSRMELRSIAEFTSTSSNTGHSSEKLSAKYGYGSWVHKKKYELLT